MTRLPGGLRVLVGLSGSWLLGCGEPSVAPARIIAAGVERSALVETGYLNGTIRFLSGGTATQQAREPVVSGTQVVWTDVTRDKWGGPLERLFLFDVGTGHVVHLTDQGLPAGPADIDAGNIIWMSQDIVRVYVSPKARITFASDGADFGVPAIGGDHAAWPHHVPTAEGVTSDIEVVDHTGAQSFVTSDAEMQMNPRIGGDYLVFEHYTGTNPGNLGDADVRAYRFSNGDLFTVAGGSAQQTQPDIDGTTIVYVESAGGADQVFAYDLTTGSARQLTTVPSAKRRPRISGSRVVWTDDRNGNLDVYLYDLASGEEAVVVALPGSQFDADIDGNRIVYTDDMTGFYRVAEFMIGGTRPQPPVVRQVNTLRGNGALAVSAVVLPGSTPVYHIALVPRFNGVPQPDVPLMPQGGDSYSGTVTGFGPQDIVTLYVVAAATSGSIGDPVPAIVAGNGGDRTEPCQSAAGASVLMDGRSSTGLSGLNLAYTWLASDPVRVLSNQAVFTTPLPRGSTNVILSVGDGRGFRGVQQATITVDDSCLSP